MKKTHRLKILVCYYNDVESGIKPFEVRFKDRDFEVGDILELYEVTDFIDFEVFETGRECKKEITYIMKNTFYVRDCYVILGIKNTV